MKDAFYFKHDYNAADDEKFSRLIRAVGHEAYGLAWRIIEKLYQNGGRISHDPELLAYDFRVDQSKIELVLACPVFFIEDGLLGAERVDRDLDERRAISEAARAAAGRRWNKGQPDADAMRSHSGPNARRGEERRVEDNTTAPAAVGQLVDGAVKATDDRLSAVELETATLPFGFGAAPDRFEKGVRIQDLPAETCQAILDKTPRLGFQLTRMLRARIAQKKEESRR